MLPYFSANSVIFHFSCVSLVSVNYLVKIQNDQPFFERFAKVHPHFWLILSVPEFQWHGGSNQSRSTVAWVRTFYIQVASLSWLISYSAFLQGPRRELPWYNHLFMGVSGWSFFLWLTKEDVKRLSSLSPTAPLILRTNIDQESPQLSAFFSLWSMNLHGSTSYLDIEV